MKQIGFTFMLFVIVLSPLAAACQEATQTDLAARNASPARPALSAAQWAKLQRMPRGEVIVVSSTYGPPLECLFAGATDAFLFCDDPGNSAEPTYQFGRPSVLRVRPPSSHAARAWVHHLSPGRLIADAIVGTIVGVGVARGGGAKAGVLMGVAGALVTEGVGEGLQTSNDPGMPTFPLRVR